MTVFLTSIQSIIPIIVIIALGYILQLKGWFSESFGPNLSRLIMNVALPPKSRKYKLKQRLQKCKASLPKG